jgi:hypothetical protein
MAATGTYVTTALLKERLDPSSQYTWAAAEDTLLGKIIAEVNQWIESFTHVVLSPITYTAATFDGFGSPRGNLLNNGKALFLPYGVRSVSLLEYAPNTGADYVTLDSDFYYLRPLEQDRLPGMPADRICLSDYLSPILKFPSGYNTIRVTGTGGPTAVPDDVRMVAITIAAASWQASKSGREEVQTIETDGSITVRLFITAEDKRTLKRYQRNQ